MYYLYNKIGKVFRKYFKPKELLENSKKRVVEVRHCWGGRGGREGERESKKNKGLK